MQQNITLVSGAYGVRLFLSGMSKFS